jgi:hypothetical protein
MGRYPEFTVTGGAHGPKDFERKDTALSYARHMSREYKETTYVRDNVTHKLCIYFRGKQTKSFRQ